MVVSDGSPGSSSLLLVPLDVTPPALLRARFEAGPAPSPPPLVAIAAASVVVVVDDVEGCFLSCCFLGDGTRELADSSPPSSPDASRDEGCARSALDRVGLGPWAERFCEALRLRLPAAEFGEDMLA